MCDHNTHYTIAPPVHLSTRKFNSQKTERDTYKKCETTYQKLLARRIQIYCAYFYVILFWSLIFFKHAKTGSQQKYSRKNQIRHVECSCAKVSGPSEVPRFARERFFSFEGSQTGVSVLDNRVLARSCC